MRDFRSYSSATIKATIEGNKRYLRRASERGEGDSPWAQASFCTLCELVEELNRRTAANIVDPIILFDLDTMTGWMELPGEMETRSVH